MKTGFIFFSLGLCLLISACRMYYTPEKIQYESVAASADLAEGKRMTMLMCAPCHMDAATKKLTGIRMHDIPGFVGKVYSSNITGHPEAGIGKYSDGDLAYLLRTGIARNGKLMPYMQRPNLADADLKNIIAFLRSDDELVSASDHQPGKTKYTPLGKLGMSKAGPLQYSARVVERPNAADQLAVGKYLVDNLSCYDCHSKSFISIDKTFPERSKGYMGGGNKLKDKSGATVLSSNLTPHETGIGDWSLDDSRRAMKEGISKDNSIISYPMPLFSELTEKETDAIFEYLRSLPPIKNKIKKKS